MAKKGEKGHYARERDAKAAALKQGLKEWEFDIDSGPKGYSIRKKPTFPAVPNAKMHAGKEPDATLEQLHEPIDKEGIIFKDRSTGRYRFMDEEDNLSNESFETAEQASIAHHERPETSVTTTIPLVYHRGAEIVGRFTSTEPNLLAESSTLNPNWTTQRAPETTTTSPSVRVPWSPKLAQAAEEAEVVGTGICTVCQSTVPIVEIEGKPTYTEHGDIRSHEDEDCDNSLEPVPGLVVITPTKPAGPIPNAGLKPHELASVQVQNGAVDRKRKSTVESPSKMVWHIADEMSEKNPQVARKDVIAECQRRGIAFYTARTQFQQWLSARRESIAHANEANQKKDE